MKPNENELDCCIVCDLLPLYIDELTEPETAKQIAEHLEHCPACCAVEQSMRTRKPAEPVSKNSLHFLKKVWHMRLFAALCTLLVTLLCIAFVYEKAFPYPNTETGRLAAIEDYVINGEVTSSDQHEIDHDIIPANFNFTGAYSIKEGTPVHLAAYTEIDNNLFVTFTVEDGFHSYGQINLIRGINGKYRPEYASYFIPYNTACMEWGEKISNWLPISDGKEEKTYHIVAGYNCKDIAAIRVEGKNYPVKKDQFLWAFKQSSLAGPEGQIALLDKDGNDITSQYKSDSWYAWNNPPALPLGINGLYRLFGIILIAGIVLAIKIYYR